MGKKGKYEARRKSALGKVVALLGTVILVLAAVFLLGRYGWNESFVTTLKLERKELVDMTYTTDPSDYVQMELTPFSQWRR